MKFHGKYRIDDLEKNMKFCKAGKVILSEKLKFLKKLIEKYLADDSVRNLHKMRIAIRRFRYVLEVFAPCYKPKLFNYVYNKMKFLQDIVGEARDLDVLSEKIRNVAGENGLSVPEKFFEQIQAEKSRVTEIIKEELIKFMDDKYVNKFLTTKKR